MHDKQYFCVLATLFFLIAMITQHSFAEDYGLLVGVSRYDKLPHNKQLPNAEHTVESIAHLLRERFRFARGNLLLLNEGEGAVARPLVAEIRQNLVQLAKQVKSGDQVVIWFSGHGSRIPNDNPNDDPEPDGLDEVFLAADADSLLNPTRGFLRDDEIGELTDSIRAKGASVLFFGDSCHSGSLTRGALTTNKPVKLLLKQTTLTEASVGDLTSIFSCQPDESTTTTFWEPSKSQPYNCSLLAYTVKDVLSRADSPITYREFGLQIQQQYNRFRQAKVTDANKFIIRMPTPTIESTQIDREVLGRRVFPNRSAIQFVKVNENLLRVNASTFDGLSEGAVLRLYPPQGTTNSTNQIGWAEVKKVDLNESVAKIVDRTSDRKERQTGLSTSTIPESGICEIEHPGCEPLPLSVWISPLAIDSKVQKILEDIETEKLIPLSVCSPYSSPNRISVENKHLILSRIEQTRTFPSVFRYDLGEVNDGLKPRVEQAVAHILRYENLKQLTFDRSGKGLSLNSLPVTLTAETKRPSASSWESFDGEVQTMTVDDLVRLRIVNRGESKVSLACFYLHEDFKVWNYDLYKPTLAQGEETTLNFEDFSIPECSGIPGCIKPASPNVLTENLVLLCVVENTGLEARDFSFLCQKSLVDHLRDASSSRSNRNLVNQSYEAVESRLHSLVIASDIELGAQRDKYSSRMPTYFACRFPLNVRGTAAGVTKDLDLRLPESATESQRNAIQQFGELEAFGIDVCGDNQCEVLAVAGKEPDSFLLLFDIDGSPTRFASSAAFDAEVLVFQGAESFIACDFDNDGRFDEVQTFGSVAIENQQYSSPDGEQSPPKTYDLNAISKRFPQNFAPKIASIGEYLIWSGIAY